MVFFIQVEEEENDETVDPRYNKDFRNDNHNEGYKNPATKVASAKLKKTIQNYRWIHSTLNIY